MFTQDAFCVYRIQQQWRRRKQHRHHHTTTTTNALDEIEAFTFIIWTVVRRVKPISCVQTSFVETLSSLDTINFNGKLWNSKHLLQSNKATYTHSVQIHFFFQNYFLIAKHLYNKPEKYIFYGNHAHTHTHFAYNFKH